MREVSELLLKQHLATFQLGFHTDKTWAKIVDNLLSAELITSTFKKTIDLGLKNTDIANIPTGSDAFLINFVYYGIIDKIDYPYDCYSMKIIQNDTPLFVLKVIRTGEHTHKMQVTIDPVASEIPESKRSEMISMGLLIVRQKLNELITTE